MRRWVVTMIACAAVLAATSRGARADGRALLPIALPGGALASPAAPVATPPPVEWSAVLSYVPVFPDARLTFFEVRDDVSPNQAEAAYETGVAAAREIEAWYWSRLPAYGWRLVTDRPGGQRWARGSGWLEIRYPRAGGDPLLRFTRDAGGVYPSFGSALDGAVPVPRRALRWRYDRADRFTEEWRLDEAPEAVLAEVALALERGGWQVREAFDTLAATRVTRFERGREETSVAVRPLANGGAELALGSDRCDVVSEDSSPTRTESVYLEAVPAPPGATIFAFDLDLATGRGAEGWRGECLDLDVFAAAAEQTLADHGWSVAPGTPRRSSGTFGLTALPPDDAEAVGVDARTADGRETVVTLTRASSGRRNPAGRSLLFADLPVPSPADALRLVTDDDDGWRYTETYGNASGIDAGQLYRRDMPSLGWAFDRLHPAASGPGQVYYGGGEEVLVGFDPDAAQISLARRRVCASGQPIPPEPIGAPARQLLEVTVYPGAIFLGFEGGDEVYLVRCAELDGLVGWYRQAMPPGSWALAGTVGPEDRFHREMVFVRPEERTVPPEQRTAWAEIVMDRTWPYQIRLTLRRDATGVRPTPTP